MLNELLIKELSNKVDINTSDIQKIKDSEVYSTNEVKTNKVWIDGKPIYRKVLTGSLNSSTNTQTVEHGISNMGQVITMAGTLYNGSARQYWNVLCYSNTNTCNVRFDTTNMYLNHTGSDIHTATYRIIVEYTKTTD